MWATESIGKLTLEVQTEDPSREYPDREFFYVDISGVDNVYGKIREWKKLIGREAPSRARQKMRAGDVLVSTVRPNLNATAIVPQFLHGQICSTGFCVLRSNERLLPKYLYFFTRSVDFVKSLTRLTRGASYPAVSKRDVEQLRIPLPPIETQRKVVDILEEADMLRQTRDQACQLPNKIIQSVFLKMFGDIAANDGKWESSAASEIFDMQLGKPLSAKEYTGKHLKPYLRNVNVQWGYLDLSDMKEMDFDDQEFRKYQLRKGDILVCEGGEVGRTAIYGGEIQNCCYQKALHRLRIREPVITSEYFVYYMQFAAKYGLLLRDTSQVTIAHFTAEKFKKLRILLPPISLQNQFASFVEKIESIKGYQEQSTEEIKELFHSLMQKAFRGELAVETSVSGVV